MTERVIQCHQKAEHNFNNPSEQLKGAIGAAAMRANSAGYIQILGGDQALVNLSSINLDADQAQKDILKAGKIGYDSFLDTMALMNTAFKPYVPLFKALGGEFFGALSDSANPNAVILDRLSEVDKKLDAIERQITQAEEELKEHNYNVISMAFLGDKNYTVQQLNGTVRTYMGDIAHPGNTTRTDAQKLQALADMYNDTLFKNLVSAVEGATLCFTSTHNDIFQKQNVFEAAYDRACEEVMFSGEAVDLTIPYLNSQLKAYLKAYATINLVYDAREAVYGVGTINQSRENMSLRLTGCDLKGNKVQKSVFECFGEYLQKDRYIFVNRNNNTNIKLNTNLLVFENFSALCTLTAISDSDTWNLPPFVRANPLNEDQVKSLADYCKKRNTTIWDFLVHDMGFGIQNMRPTDTDFLKLGDHEEMRNQNPNEAERMMGITYTPNIYMATGAQSQGKLERKTINAILSKYQDYWVKMNVVNACVKGAGNENKLLRHVYKQSGADPENTIYDIHLLTFQSR